MSSVPPQGRPHSRPGPRQWQETFLTILQVAVRLNVSTRTVRRWIEGGELVAHRLGAA
jgi:excisionase family DNA binding protein